MTFNWLDLLLAGVAVVAVIVGLTKGFFRETIGLASVVLGLILAGQYYENLAAVLQSIITHRELNYFVSFLIVFLAVVVAGGVIAVLLTRVAKGSIKFLNHLLGGLFGFLKGVLVGGVLVLALLVFSVDRTAVVESWLAPYALYVTNGIVQLVPRELKTRFKLIHRDIKGKVGKHGQER
jgi:membrane protein required for colicin V production